MFTHLSTYQPPTVYSSDSVPILVPSHRLSCLPSPFSHPLSLYSTVQPPIHSHVWTPFLCSCGRPSSYLLTGQLPHGLPFLFLHNTFLPHLSAIRSSLPPVSIHRSSRCSSVFPCSSSQPPMEPPLSPSVHSFLETPSSYSTPFHPSIHPFKVGNLRPGKHCAQLRSCGHVISRVEIQQPSGNNQRNFMLCLSVFAGDGTGSLASPPRTCCPHSPSPCSL